MDRLHSMEVFVAVAESGSLAEAARRLRLSPPAVTRAVAALEDRLGTALLTRTTRSLRLTDAGARFLDDARRILADLEAAERLAAPASEPHGHLTVTAPVTFGRLVVTPIVGAFLRDNPRLSASVIMVDRMVSLVDEGVDLAIRIGDLPDSSLVARRAGEVRRLLVAAPDYLARHGTPAHPRDLDAHAFIAFTGLTAGRAWSGRDGDRPLSVPLSPRLSLNDAAAAIGAAARGEGITEVLSYMVTSEIASGALVPVLEAFAPKAVPVQIVHAEGRTPAPKVRAFAAFAGPKIEAALASRG